MLCEKPGTSPPRVTATAVLALAMLSLIALTGGAAAADMVRLRADPWCPYNCKPKAALPGYVIEISAFAFSRAGLVLDYQTRPWARAIAEVHENRIDGVIGVNHTGEGEGLILHEESFGDAMVVLVLPRATAFTFEGLGSLKALRLGVGNGYSYGDEIDDYLKRNAGSLQPVDYALGDDLVDLQLRKLLIGRIDGFLEWHVVALYGMRRSGASAELQLIQVSKPEPMFIGFAPGLPRSREFAKLIDDGIAQLRLSGELSRILARYGLRDWK